MITVRETTKISVLSSETTRYHVREECRPSRSLFPARLSTVLQHSHHSVVTLLQISVYLCLQSQSFSDSPDKEVSHILHIYLDIQVSKNFLKTCIFGSFCTVSGVL